MAILGALALLAVFFSTPAGKFRRTILVIAEKNFSGETRKG
jgi:hypothetical protein